MNICLIFTTEDQKRYYELLFNTSFCREKVNKMAYYYYFQGKIKVACHWLKKEQPSDCLALMRYFVNTNIYIYLLTTSMSHRHHIKTINGSGSLLSFIRFGQKSNFHKTWISSINTHTSLCGRIKRVAYQWFTLPTQGLQVWCRNPASQTNTVPQSAPTCPQFN